LERILYLGDVLNRLEDNIETNLKNVSSLDLPSDKTEKVQVTKRPSTQWSRSQTALLYAGILLGVITASSLFALTSTATSSWVSNKVIMDLRANM
jgi:hypothetical protein